MIMETPEKNVILRSLPSVDELIHAPDLSAVSTRYPRSLVVNAARAVLDDVRRELLASETITVTQRESIWAIIINRVTGFIEEQNAFSLKPAINATGIILHTGLGRALLPDEAVENVNRIIDGYCTLAVEPGTGKRGHRDTHLHSLLCELTGAEDATVVNNNAAATMLILNTMAQGKEVIVSRGQLVEIGGSFRMPDVMEQSGAILHEIGTTNKVHLRDYEQAINENTGAILHVHMSNYRIMGFFSEPSIEELVPLGKQYGIPVIDDLGSGALVDLSQYGLEKEPMVQDSIKAGVNVACFSGDKLIGGPQAGIIVGKQDAVRRIRKNQLARALRIGKMTIAGMEATLRLFRDPEKLNESHPFYRILSISIEELNDRAQRVKDTVQSYAGRLADVSVEENATQVGSGSVPTETVPTRVLQVKPTDCTPGECARRLRNADPGIFPRVQNDAVLFDFRTIHPDEDEIVGSKIIEALKDDA
jgi:L-seryl-tRNA(Ser) seleniumtransferase